MKAGYGSNPRGDAAGYPVQFDSLRQATTATHMGQDSCPSTAFLPCGLAAELLPL